MNQTNTPVADNRLKLARIIMFAVPPVMVLISLIAEHMQWGAILHMLNLELAIPLFMLTTVATIATFWMPMVGCSVYIFLMMAFPASLISACAIDIPEDFNYWEYILGAAWMDITAISVIIYLIVIMSDVRRPLRVAKMRRAFR